MPPLPIDLWSQIIRILSLTNDILSLKSISLTSRAIGYEADKYLWDNLKIQSLGSLNSLSRMILEGTRISLHLSKLCTQIPSHKSSTPVDSTQLKGALLRCKKLTVLELLIGIQGTGFVSDLKIPSLQMFSTDLPVDSCMSRFLARHPDIVELHMSGEVTVGTDLTSEYALLVGDFIMM